MVNESKTQILVVDKDLLILQSLVDYFSSIDFEVYLAENGLVGLNIFQREHPDVVLIDLFMSEASGLAMFEEIKESFPETPIVLMSKINDAETSVEAIRAGAWDFIHKPFQDMSDVEYIINRVLERARLLQENRNYQENLEKIIQKRMVQLYHKIAEHQKSEKKFSTLVYHAPYGIIVVDKLGTIVLSNRQAQKMFGYTQEKLIGKRIEILVPKSLHNKHRELRQEYMKHPSTRQMGAGRYLSGLHQNGREFPIEVSLNKIEFDNATHIVATIQDLSEIQEANEELRLNKEILENITEGVTLVRLKDAKIIYANPSFKKMFGYDSGEILGKSISLINAPTSKSPEETTKEIVRKVMETGGWKGEIKNIKKNGTLIWTLTNISMFEHVEHGKVLISLKEDITIQKQNNDILQKYKYIISITKDRIAFVDRHYIYQSINQAYAEVRNKETKEIIGHTMAEVLGQEYFETSIKPYFDRSLTGEKVHDQRWYNYSEIGKRYLDITYYPFFDKDSTTGCVLYIRDITEQYLAQQEAEQHRMQLMQADKLVSLGTLVAGVAHEINNPNSYVMLNAPLLQSIWEEVLPFLDDYRKTHGNFSVGSIPYDTVRQRIPLLLSAIQEGSQRIKDIVLNLKDFAREDSSGNNQKVDLNEVVHSSVTLTKNRIKKATHYFNVNCSPELPTIQGNFQRLEQVVINLIINACDALPDNQRKVEITTLFDQKQKKVFLRLMDEGSGMSQEVLQNVKDPFFTTKRNTGGTGLGLSISNSIVEDHGGTLVLQSTPNEGTIATICFPLPND